MTDAGLKELKELKNHTWLYLAKQKVTDVGLKELRDLNDLSALDLRHTQVTDTGLKELKHLKNLTKLFLDGTQVTDAGLRELKDLKKLEVILLGGTKVTNGGVKELQEALPLSRFTRNAAGPRERLETTMTADDFRSLALSLPEASEGAHMGHADFRVGGKVFATLGPKEEWGMVKLTPDQQALFVRTEPDVFEPFNGAWGKRGCTKVDIDSASEPAVRQALILAWRNTAPKRLANQLDA